MPHMVIGALLGAALGFAVGRWQQTGAPPGRRRALWFALAGLLIGAAVAGSTPPGPCGEGSGACAPAGALRW